MVQIFIEYRQLPVIYRTFNSSTHNYSQTVGSLDVVMVFRTVLVKCA